MPRRDHPRPPARRSSAGDGGSSVLIAFACFAAVGLLAFAAVTFRDDPARQPAPSPPSAAKNHAPSDDGVAGDPTQPVNNAAASEPTDVLPHTHANDTSLREPSVSTTEPEQPKQNDTPTPPTPDPQLIPTETLKTVFGSGSLADARALAAGDPPLAEWDGESLRIALGVAIMRDAYDQADFLLANAPLEHLTAQERVSVIQHMRVSDSVACREWIRRSQVLPLLLPDDKQTHSTFIRTAIYARDQEGVETMLNRGARATGQELQLAQRLGLPVIANLLRGRAP